MGESEESGGVTLPSQGPEALAAALMKAGLGDMVRETVRDELRSLAKPAGHAYAIQADLLSPPDVERLNEIMSVIIATDGTAAVIRGNEVDRSMRDSRTVFVNPYDDKWNDPEERQFLQSVYIRVVGLAHVARSDRMNGLPPIAGRPAEQMQFTEYQDGQFYNAHQDSDAGNPERRVISMSLLVRAADSGGDFEFRDMQMPPEHMAMIQKPGSAIVFPSSAYHLVTPVGEGMRRSIVFWFSAAVNQKPAK